MGERRSAVLEIAVHPNTGNDEVVAAVNGFRRTAEATPLSQICREYAASGAPLAEARQMPGRDRPAQSRECRAAEETSRLNRRRTLPAARRLDTAYRRVYELTEEALAARRLGPKPRSASSRNSAPPMRSSWTVCATTIAGCAGRSTKPGAMSRRIRRGRRRGRSAIFSPRRGRQADDAAAVVGDGTGSGAKLPWSA